MTAKTIKTFYEELVKVGVRESQEFRFYVTNTGIDAVDKTLENAVLWAHGSEVPGVTVNKANVSFNAFPFFVLTNVTLTNEMQVTFNCDAKSSIREAFLLWANTGVDFDIDGGSKLGGNKRPSSAIMRVDLLNETMDDVVTTYKLYGVMPTNVGTMTLSNIDANVATFQVTLSYQYWNIEKSAN